MDIFQVFLLTALAAGIILTALGLGKTDWQDGKAKADSFLDELNATSQAVISQIDGKYEELLFLYNLIDEKKVEVKVTALPVNIPHPATPPPAPNFDRIFEAPGRRRVIELRKNGLTVDETAQELNMSKGEVWLISELYAKERGEGFA